MKLFFHAFGDGPPLVILHGLFGVSDNWVTMGKRLSGQYRVFIPDLRNHGKSPHSPVFDFPALEDDLSEFIESLDLEKVILLGHSLGGKIAMFFALHQPQRVEKLVVADISLRRYPHNREHQQLIDAMMSTDLSGVTGRTEVETLLSGKIPDQRLRQFVMKNLYWRDKTHLDWRLNIRAINDNLHAIFEGVEVTGEYPGPALFIRGGRSAYVSDDDLVLIKQKFPGAVVRTIPNAGHWIHADAPGEFYDILADFLSGSNNA